MAWRVRIDNANLIKAGTCTLGTGATQLLAAETRRANAVGVFIQPAADAGDVTIGDATNQDIILPADGLYLATADPWQLYVKGTQNKKVYYLLLR